MAKLKLTEKQCTDGIRYLNSHAGLDIDNILGYYQFQDMFEAMGIELSGMPDSDEFSGHGESVKPEEMSTGYAQNLFDNINKV